jgi:hypothetical protein
MALICEADFTNIPVYAIAFLAVDRRTTTRKASVSAGAFFVIPIMF